MKFFSRLHDSLRSGRLTHPAAQTSIGVSKTYPRFNAIELPQPALPTLPLPDALRLRRSFNTCASDRALTLNEWGSLLGGALGMRTAESRMYPSGGALFPIESYVIGHVIEEKQRAVFHYDPKRNALEELWDIPESLPMKRIFRGSVTPLSATAIVFTAVWDRSSGKYGTFTYDLALLEAGHMAQNILLAATALGLAARPIGGFDDTTLQTLLDLPHDREQPVYAIMLCPAAGATESVEPLTVEE